MSHIDKQYCLLRFEEVLLDAELKHLLGFKYHFKSEDWKSLWMHFNRSERIQKAIKYINNLDLKL
jgi:hypothetical protein